MPARGKWSSQIIPTPDFFSFGTIAVPATPPTAEKAGGGILNIYKPSGITSFQVVKKVRAILTQKKDRHLMPVGHCGTLDPMAEGVLVLLFGHATGCFQKIVSEKKVYRAKMKMGIKTDTGDITGKVIETMPVPELNESYVQERFKKFCGPHLQKTPLYSAVKRGGKKLYEYARAGIQISAPLRQVEIFSLELLAIEKCLHPPPAGPSILEFRVCCSSGTYIRSLAEDLGREFGSCATLSTLIREQCGSFAIQDSISWENLLAMDRTELLSRAIAVP